MTGKRQHYIPRFLQRRFAIDPADKRSLIHWLDLSSGRPERANIANAAVRSRYYRIVRDDGTVDDSADEILDRIESEAAPAIARLADARVKPDRRLLEALALFIVTLKQRTPEGRQQLREADRQMAELWLEMQLSDRDGYVERMRGRRAGQSDAAMTTSARRCCAICAADASRWTRRRRAKWR
jgi:hypothetical protein